MSLNLNLESAVKKLEAGCIKGNCIDGQGTLITPKKDKYIGRWKDSKPYGQGVYTFINGDKYVGYSKNGKIHGQGVYTFKDGAEILPANMVNPNETYQAFKSGIRYNHHLWSLNGFESLPLRSVF